jgi:hypothetical protein
LAGQLLPVQVLPKKQANQPTSIGVGKRSKINSRATTFVKEWEQEKMKNQMKKNSGKNPT